MKKMLKMLKVVLFSALVLAFAVKRPAQAQLATRAAGSSGTWVTGWATSQQTLGDVRITNATVRMIARVTIPSDTIRIRLDNTFGAEPVTIGRAYIGQRVQQAALAAGSNRPLTFGGAPQVTIPAEGSSWSDPVQLTVLAQQDLAVSLFIPGENVRPSQHTNAVVTSYVSADGSGDVSSEEGRGPFTSTMRSFWWLKAIDVQSAPLSGAIVAFGDSITDGTCTTLDAHDRWEDVLSVRLNVDHDTNAGGRGSRDSLRAVLNEGIGGNTVTREGLSPPANSPTGLERLDRDVLSHHGVTDVVVFEGTNDVRRGAPAAQVIAGITSLIQRVKARGLRIVGATIIPRHNVTPVGPDVGWDQNKTRIRNEINQWIRTKAGFDDVIDFDKVVRDPANPDLLYAPFNCGDGIHPSPSGYYAMGKAVELDLFRSRGPRR